MRRIAPALLLILALAGTARAAGPIPFPGDARLVDVTRAPYLARGDGLADDTAAIQKALDDHPNAGAVVYLPRGVYLISETLRWPHGSRGGMEEKNTILQGQGRDFTTLKVKPSCPGFADPANPRAMIWTGQAPAQRFRNAVRDLTLDTGSGNPGAIGIRFNASNQGTLRGVTIRSGDAPGVVGLDLAFTDEIGPCLIKDLRVVGFRVGVACAYTVDSVTFEDVTLEDQLDYALRNNGQCLSIRNLTVRGEVTAVSNVGGVGLVTLIGATFEGRGRASGRPAIENAAHLYARDVRSSGFRMALDAQKDEMDVPGATIAEYPSHPPLTLFPSRPGSLRLPIEETPEVPADPPADWASPTHFGIEVGDNLLPEATAAIQAAIDSGKPTVYLPRGAYKVDGTIRLRGKVRRLVGLEASLFGKGTIRLEDGEAPAVVVERLQVVYAPIDVEQASSRTLVLKSSIIRDFKATGRGDVFLEDVCGDHFRFGRGRAWARQLNTEPQGDHILNDGGTLWVLGLKTERGGTLIETRGGGRTEVLGGFCYTTTPPDGAPMFVCRDSSLSVSLGESCFAGHPYEVLVRESRGGVTRDLKRGSAPGRTGGSVLPLFVGAAP